ncbi:hypothetical protein PLESTB_001467200 [Pleodorina starrii]|uniref:N-acetyltransferase domain-containing protein n=1 Tax=Pleodorina starrii TaxID=330485 RepID=A0A9W6BWQ7_9CHLO|nr:hypothetical protein PLESTM_001685500 [Pleodorina starrii]GLC59257.1 hypothetical protein PLESTB_001467200 [Pleodorina starrii]GLC74822.1 hypothetical protein PLESTF_001559800 [Pleodorina starrii]
MSTAQGERRLRLAATRSLLYQLPSNELFELPGRPHVVYQLRSYAHSASADEAAQQARNDSPFLFKAFETGQIGPKRLARMHGDKPRVATIHEYLDWTVTAQAAEGDDELDFDGFRVLVILPRYRSGWPPPGGEVTAPGEPRKHRPIGAPKSPLPTLQTHGKPVTAATIRSGPGYLEIPFVATHENKRGRGYCRCLVEAIEEIARALGLKKLMLCSTNDASVQSTWQHLGFEYAPDEQMEEWDILHTDLVYLQNTTQMHKDVPPPRRLKSVVIRHEDFRQRCYAFVGQKRPQRPAGSAHAASLPQASRPRISSRRSDSTSRDESQSVAARERPLGAGPSGFVGKASPVSAGLPLTTPQAAASATGRLHSRAAAGDEVGRPSAGAARDDGIAGGGPPTPQPADGGHLRPLHAAAGSDPPRASQTNFAHRVHPSIGNGIALAGTEQYALCEGGPVAMWSHGMQLGSIAPGGPAGGPLEASSVADGGAQQGLGSQWHAGWAGTDKHGLGHGQAPARFLPLQDGGEGAQLVHGPAFLHPGLHPGPHLGALHRPGGSDPSLQPAVQAHMQGDMQPSALPLGLQPRFAGVSAGVQDGAMQVVLTGVQPGQPRVMSGTFPGLGMAGGASGLQPDGAG